MGPLLWLGRLCRGYRKAYLTESSEMPRPWFWGAKLTQLTITYRCICIKGLFSPLLVPRCFY